MKWWYYFFKEKWNIRIFLIHELNYLWIWIIWGIYFLFLFFNDFLKILFIWCCLAYFFLLFRLIFIFVIEAFIFSLFFFNFLIEDSYMIWSTWLLGDPWLLKISLIQLIIKFFFFTNAPSSTREREKKF